MTGRLTVTCGPMFAGKSTALQSDIELFASPYRVFKPELDTRSPGRIVLHNGSYIDAIEVDATDGSLCAHLDEGVRTIFIDEIQFFGAWITREIIYLILERNIDVHVYGLDLDYKGGAWPRMSELLPLADEVHKLKAICQMCGKLASKTVRISHEEYQNQVMVGAADLYEPRCNLHFAEHFHEDIAD